MVIGALIGLLLASIHTWIGFNRLYREKAYYRSHGIVGKITIHYAPMIARHVVFTLAGAIIGYFVS